MRKKGEMSRRHNVDDQTWIKNHPLEGDGLVTGFYNVLFKRNTKTLKPCKDVFIPDTIVFDHNFPRGWYTSDLKAKEISKKQGKELDPASIASSFASAPSPNVSIVASYMCSFEVDNDSEVCTQVEFFNESSLKEFVARKVKNEGILQRFLIPKGSNNCVIQAIWSPLIFSCKRRTNVSMVSDKIQTDRDPYPVAVTYEGPSHFSQEGNCAVETTAQIKEICKNIVEHFYNTEHKYITRMVLYFKVDERNQLWFLWCGSLRVSDRGNKSQMPVNLATVFTSPSLLANSPKKHDKMLHENDLKHLAMTHDAIFYETYIRDYNNGFPHRGSPLLKIVGSEGPNGADKQATIDKEAVEREERARNEDNSWQSLPGIAEQYRELQADKERVLSAFQDIFYEAYGHFLRHDPGPFNFQVDRMVVKTLSEELLHDLMQHLKVDPTILSDEAVENDELWFSIPLCHRNPLARMGDEAARWTETHFKDKEQELKDEASSMPHNPRVIYKSDVPEVTENWKGNKKESEMESGNVSEMESGNASDKKSERSSDSQGCRSEDSIRSHSTSASEKNDCVQSCGDKDDDNDEL